MSSLQFTQASKRSIRSLSDVILVVFDNGGNSSKVEFRFADNPLKKDSRLPDKMRAFPRLADSIQKNGGHISKSARAEAMKFLRLVKAQIEDVQAAHPNSAFALRAIGTAPFRDAINGNRLAEHIRNKTHLPLEILSSDQEAHYAARGVLARAKDPEKISGIVVDMGGGSADFAVIENGQILEEYSHGLPLGTLMIRGAKDQAKFIRSHIKTLPDIYRDFDSIFVTGGTPRTMQKSFAAKMNMSLGGEFGSQSVSAEEYLQFCEELLERRAVLSSLGKKAMGEALDIKPDRVDLIEFPHLLVREITAELGVQHMTLNKATSRDGIRAEMVEHVQEMLDLEHERAPVYIRDRPHQMAEMPRVVFA